MKNIKLTFAGDLFPGNIIESVGIGIGSQFANHNGRPWKSQLKEHFSKSDFAFVNLESPLLNDRIKSQNSTFAGSIDFAVFMRDIGITAASVANNHILEHNVEGFQSTIKSLEKHNILPIGIYKDQKSDIQRITLKGIELGIVGFNNIHDIKNNSQYANYSRQSVFDSIDIMNSQKFDYKIISIHWGDEYVNIPSSKQIDDARAFIDKGANIVIGHHPHTIQQFEEYNGGLIFYSLGNFMSDMIWSKNVRMGGVANIYLNKEKILKSSLNPVYIDNNYIPKHIDDNNFNDFLQKNKNILNNFNHDNKSSYDKDYSSLKNNKHFLNRIWMKKILLKNWFKLPGNHRTTILKNILSRFKI